MDNLNFLHKISLVKKILQNDENVFLWLGLMTVKRVSFFPPLRGTEWRFYLSVPITGTEQLWSLNTICSFQGSQTCNTRGAFLTWMCHLEDICPAEPHHLTFHWRLCCLITTVSKPTWCAQTCVCVIHLLPCFAVALCNHSLPTELCGLLGKGSIERASSMASPWSSSLVEARFSHLLSKETFLCWTQSLVRTLWHAAQRRSG